MEVDDTIVAIASPTSPATRGIVRLSGSRTIAILHCLGIPCPEGSHACRFETQVDLGRPIGEIPVSVMVWPTTRSYTGQPSAELHTFGSLPLMTGLVDAVIASGGRAARPGEFTMRAFLAGRLDLTQAEAVLGVIEAEGRGSLDLALQQLAGNLSRPLERIRGILLDLLADVEAGLDFVDEDIEFISDETLVSRLSELREHLNETSRRMQLRGGGAARASIAVRGEPNAGKSCLINRLADQQVAIVADLAGTTRDAVTIDTKIGDLSVTLVDTAGIEDTDSEVSRQSQRQAERASENAAVRLWCVDSSREEFALARVQIEQLSEATRRPSVIDLKVATKADLGVPQSPRSDWIYCSAVTGAGIDQLTEAIDQALSIRDAEEIGSVVGTAARCGQSLLRARDAISAAISLVAAEQGHEFVASEIRLATECLGEVTGAVYTEDILDRVFGRFCIGK